MRVQFLGHSTVLIEAPGATLLTDPVLRPRLAHLTRRAPLPVAPPAHALDAVLISHIHQDHLDFRSLALLGKEVRAIVPRGAGRLLRRHGYHNVTEVAVGQRVRVGDARVLATPAKHDGFRPPFGPRAECLGYIVEADERVYFAGDTDLFAGMDALGPLHLALLPVWGWGPTLGPGHLDPARAARALTHLRPTAAIPIHWGTLHPFGLGRWSRTYLAQPPRTFAALAREIAPEVQVHLIAPGGAWTLDGEE